MTLEHSQQGIGQPAGDLETRIAALEVELQAMKEALIAIPNALEQ
jgi:hypothetical protein